MRIVPLLLLLTLLLACNKEDCRNCTTIEGYIYSNNRTEAVGNIDLELVWHYKGGLYPDDKSELIAAATSDQNGYFKMNHKFTDKQLSKGHYRLSLKKTLLTTSDVFVAPTTIELFGFNDFEKGNTYTLIYDLYKLAYLDISIISKPQNLNTYDFTSNYGFQADTLHYSNKIFIMDMSNPFKLEVPADFDFKLYTYKHKGGTTVTIIDSFYLFPGEVRKYSITY